MEVTRIDKNALDLWSCIGDSRPFFRHLPSAPRSRSPLHAGRERPWRQIGGEGAKRYESRILL